jgi:hypothetical protein
MGTRYKLLENIPLDIWYRIGDFLYPSDVENILNTAASLWRCMFKDNHWLELALTYRKSVPVLLGRNLSRFRLDRSNNLYFVLLAGDFSGDLRFCSEKFFESLQDGYKYDEKRKEVYFPSGIRVNVSEVMDGVEEPYLPIQRLFSTKNNELQLEYCFYQDTAIKVLVPPNIIGINGPSYRRIDIRYGCALRLSYQGKSRQWFINNRGRRKETWTNKWDDSGLSSSLTTEPRSWTRNTRMQ